MKRIVCKRPDGGVTIIVPTINSYPQRENLTEDQALERAHKDIPPDATDIIIVDEADIPTDRTYRNAWTHDGKSVVHDMAKARDVHRHNLRERRIAAMAESDVTFLKALEGWIGTQPAIPEELRSAIARKDELRDVTSLPAIDSAKTIDDLKAVQPACLDCASIRRGSFG